jgi:hypothetical protein
MARHASPSGRLLLLHDLLQELRDQRDHQMARLRGLRVIQPRERDRSSVWYVLHALLRARVIAVSLTDVQQTGHGRQELLYPGEAAWRPQGGDEGLVVVGQEPCLAVGRHGTIKALGVRTA